MTTSDWMIVCATLIGPIVAVQVQKAIERARDSRNQKSWVFHQLMATRAAQLSPQHVQALNMIDLAFYGKGPGRRSKSAQKVLDQWKEYLDHLSDYAFRDRDLDAWITKAQDMQVDLLVYIGNDVGFSFDRVQLKKGSYNPEAHGRLEEEQNKLRRLAIDVLQGTTPLAMNVVGFPTDDEAIDAQTELSAKLSKAIVDGEIRVRLAAGSVDPAVPDAAPGNAP